MDDRQLAIEIVERLNKLVQDNPDVLKFVRNLIEARVLVSGSIADHPTIQVQEVSDPLGTLYQAGFLGLLNGLVGVIQDKGGRWNRWGYIAACYSSDGSELISFRIVDTDQRE